MTKNRTQIEALLNDKTRQEQEEAEKNAASDRILKARVKPSLAEKIEKTALNTGIRFNIVDNLGFDNASLHMFQDA